MKNIINELKKELKERSLTFLELNNKLSNICYVCESETERELLKLIESGGISYQLKNKDARIIIEFIANLNNNNIWNSILEIQDIL